MPLRKLVARTSIIWKAPVKDFPSIGNKLAWRVGNGPRVRLGGDPWVLAPKVLGKYRVHAQTKSCASIPVLACPSICARSDKKRAADQALTSFLKCAPKSSYANAC
jgi:hypothetical protein